MDSNCSAGNDEFADESAAYEEPADAFDVDMSVVKSKKFEMTPCTVKDAVLALDYIDHPFYVFRNSATKEVSATTNSSINVHAALISACCAVTPVLLLKARSTSLPL